MSTYQIYAYFCKMRLKINTKILELNLLNTKTAEIISKSSNFRSSINTWGDEIYFKTPIKAIKLEANSRDIINFGEVAYWVEGNSIAIGFGKTPASINNEIRLVSRVNIWAKFNTEIFNTDFFRCLNDDDLIDLLN